MPVQVGLGLGLATELVGAATLYLMLEIAVGGAEEKARLIAEMSSGVRAIAVPALEKLTDRGWLYDGSLKEAQLQGANLQGADLTKANLQGANLAWANLQGADPILANLQGADLFMANLQGADLSKANLQEADLAGADLAGADLREATCEG